MSKFRLEYVDPENSNNTLVLSLSSTTNISVSESAKVSSYPVEDGTTVIDNYIIDNRVITFQGVITDVGVVGLTSQPLVKDWITELRALRSRKQFVTVHTSGIDAILNCVITDFQLDKSKDEGLSGWKCSLTMKEVDVSERVRLVEVKVANKEVADEVAGKSKTSDSTTKEVAIGSSTLVDGAELLRSSNINQGSS